MNINHEDLLGYTAETSVDFQRSIRRHNSRNHCCESLKSNNLNYEYMHQLKQSRGGLSLHQVKLSQ
jgi:hypothetical protein